MLRSRRSRRTTCAFQTESGAGSRYSRMPLTLTASCQTAISSDEQRDGRPVLAQSSALDISSISLCCTISARLANAIWPSRQGSSVKLSLCNEVIRELPFDRQCALAAGLGYRGLEIAPFTFGDDAWRMPAAQASGNPRGLRRRRHRGERPALAAGGAGRASRSPRADRAVWQKSVDVLRALGRALRRSGRRLSGARLAGAAPRRAIADAPSAPRRPGASRPQAAGRPASPIASSRWPRPDCNFVNTLAEAADVVRAHRQSRRSSIMVDTLAAESEEKEPVADADPALDADRPDGAYPVQRPQQARAGAGRRQVRAGRSRAARNRLRRLGGDGAFRL